MGQTGKQTDAMVYIIKLLFSFRKENMIKRNRSKTKRLIKRTNK